jgi:hypothetical protein
MPLSLANVQTTDTFQTWLTRTNQIIVEAANSNPQSLSIGSHIDLTANTVPVAYNAGRLFYDGTAQGLTFYNNESEVGLQIGQEQWIRVYNDTGSDITDGTPVYLTGEVGAIPTIAPADASLAAKVHAVGLATHTIENGTYGFVTSLGIVQGIDTSALTAGQTVHVAPGGGLVTAAPLYPNYPHEVGFVLISDASNGCIYVDTQQHYLERIRIANDARIEGNLIVDGNFTVLGAETVTSLTNLSVDDTFIYFSTGGTVTANTSLATGLKDLTFKGHYEGGNNVTYYVKIDSTGGGVADKFSWSFDNFSTTEAANVAIDSTEQSLRFGIKVQFVANTGHTAGDIWRGDAAPLNIDTGWVSNRNPGFAAGGYTHLGVFFDVSDERFRFFQSYAPEIEGTINITDPSFQYGDVQANTYYGIFNGDGSSITALNATQLTSGTVPEARLTVADTSTKGIASFSSDNFAVAAGVVTIKDNGIILGTETTGNYVATVANTDSNITITGSGSETAAVSVGLADDVNVSGTITASAFVGDGSGLTNAGATIAAKSDNVDYKVTFTNQLNGAHANTFVNTSLLFNPSTGQLSATDFNSTSDARLKKNVKPIDGALTKVMALAGVEFNWVESDKAAIGVIAQQVEQVVPELVHTNESGYKSVSYGNLAALLIEAVKELKTIVDNK